MLSNILGEVAERKRSELFKSILRFGWWLAREEVSISVGRDHPLSAKSYSCFTVIFGDTFSKKEPALASKDLPGYRKDVSLGLLERRDLFTSSGNIYCQPLFKKSRSLPYGIALGNHSAVLHWWFDEFEEVEWILASAKTDHRIFIRRDSTTSISGQRGHCSGTWLRAIGE